MVSSPHRLVSSMKGGEQILSSGDRGEARISTARPIQQPTPRSHPWACRHTRAHVPRERGHSH